jgi:hypothetical protein
MAASVTGSFEAVAASATAWIKRMAHHKNPWMRIAVVALGIALPIIGLHGLWQANVVGLLLGVVTIPFSFTIWDAMAEEAPLSGSASPAQPVGQEVMKLLRKGSAWVVELVTPPKKPSAATGLPPVKEEEGS